MATHIDVRMTVTSAVAINPWRNTWRAFLKSFAPMKWAACTEKPSAAADVSPPNSHVVDSTMPIDAEAFAPSEPTIDASM